MLHLLWIQIQTGGRLGIAENDLVVLVKCQNLQRQGLNHAL